MTKVEELDPDSLEARIIEAFRVCRDQSLQELARRIQCRHGTMDTPQAVKGEIDKMIRAGRVVAKKYSFRLAAPKINTRK